MDSSADNTPKKISPNKSNEINSIINIIPITLESNTSESQIIMSPSEV